METKITIIMPSLNVKFYIEECIESVLAQSLKEIEILCIDAGSTDGTYEILQKYEREDERIRLIHSAKKSYGYQMNIGLKCAKGKYVGIVETDDYILKDMYKNLFEVAEQADVDFIKSDYLSYYTLKNQKRILTEEHLFNQGLTDYNKVITPYMNKKIMTNDSNIWKGIYKTEFLRKNNIYFHETEGAAFQDIGFMMQVFRFANRGLYLRQPYYCYCMDRESSSSNSIRGLVYAYQEFRWLVEEKKILSDAPQEYRNGFYSRMGISFVGEYRKMLLLNNNLDDEATQYWNWFCDVLTEAKQTGNLLMDQYSEESRNELQLLIKSEKEYKEYVWHRKEEKRKKSEELVQYIEDKQVIIFGCGKYGREALLMLNKKDIIPVAFCDNNQKQWKTEIADIQVESLSDCLQKYNKAYFIIANKYHADEIYKQLCDEGVEKNHIVFYEKV